MTYIRPVKFKVRRVKGDGSKWGDSDGEAIKRKAEEGGGSKGVF